MPIFQENPEAFAELESQLYFSPEIIITPIDENTVQINCQKRKIMVDTERAIPDEECRRVDPDNPILESNYRPITVDHLSRIGTIDPEWWEWLKVKDWPAFGPKVVVQCDGNKMKFLKGASLLDSLEFGDGKISFQALFLKKTVDWNLSDFISFMTKFKSKVL